MSKPRAGNDAGSSGKGEGKMRRLDEEADDILRGVGHEHATVSEQQQLTGEGTESPELADPQGDDVLEILRTIEDSAATRDRVAQKYAPAQGGAPSISDTFGGLDPVPRGEGSRDSSRGRSGQRTNPPSREPSSGRTIRPPSETKDPAERARRLKEMQTQLPHLEGLTGNFETLKLWINSDVDHDKQMAAIFKHDEVSEDDMHFAMAHACREVEAAFLEYKRLRFGVLKEKPDNTVSYTTFVEDPATLGGNNPEDVLRAFRHGADMTRDGVHFALKLVNMVKIRRAIKKAILPLKDEIAKIDVVCCMLQQPNARYAFLKQEALSEKVLKEVAIFLNKRARYWIRHYEESLENDLDEKFGDYVEAVPHESLFPRTPADIFDFIELDDDVIRSINLSEGPEYTSESTELREQQRRVMAAMEKNPKLRQNFRGSVWYMARMVQNCEMLIEKYKGAETAEEVDTLTRKFMKGLKGMKVDERVGISYERRQTREEPVKIKIKNQAEHMPTIGTRLEEGGVYVKQD